MTAVNGQGRVLTVMVFHVEGIPVIEVERRCDRSGVQAWRCLPSPLELMHHQQGNRRHRIPSPRGTQWGDQSEWQGFLHGVGDRVVNDPERDWRQV